MINTAYNRQFNNSAKYNKVLHFEERGQVQNEEGYWIDGWVDSDLGRTNAQVRNIRGNEYIMAGANQVKVSARINMRYRKDVEDKYYELGEKLRLVLKQPGRKGRIFNIEYMNNLEEKNIELELIVNEVR